MQGELYLHCRMRNKSEFSFMYNDDLMSDD